MTVTPHPDLVAGPFSDELTGVRLEYRYSTGNHYEISFGTDGVHFSRLAEGTGEVVEGPIGPLPYLVRRLRDQLFLVHWINRPGIHVALVVDLDEGRVHSSAMMPPGSWEFFDIAEILDVRRPDDPRHGPVSPPRDPARRAP